MDLDAKESKNFIHYIKFDEDELFEHTSSNDISSFLGRPSLKEKTEDIEQTFISIKKVIKNSKSQNVFLDIHLSYFARSEFFPPLQSSNLKELVSDDKPIKVITLMDDVFLVHNNLKKRESLHPKTSLRLREILAWRSVELLQAESVATVFTTENRNVKNYLVSIRHPFNTFFNLILNTNPITLYLSFPISKTRINPDSVSEINNVRKNLHETIETKQGVLFDPVTIDELPPSILGVSDTSADAMFQLDKDARWPIENNNLSEEPEWPIKILTNEVIESNDDLANQVRVRDFKLIDNSMFTIAYRPNFGGPSIGVNAEMNYTTGQGKRLYVFEPKEDKKPGSNPFNTNSIPVDNYEKFKQRILEYISFLKSKKVRNT